MSPWLPLPGMRAQYELSYPVPRGSPPGVHRGSSEHPPTVDGPVCSVPSWLPLASSLGQPPGLGAGGWSPLLSLSLMGGGPRAGASHPYRASGTQGSGPRWAWVTWGHPCRGWGEREPPPVGSWQADDGAAGVSDVPGALGRSAGFSKGDIWTGEPRVGVWLWKTGVTGRQRAFSLEREASAVPRPRPRVSRALQESGN